MFGRTVICTYDNQPTDSTNPQKNRNRNAERNTRIVMYNDENNRKTPKTQQNQEITSDNDQQQISDTQQKENQESITEQETNHTQNTIQGNTVRRKPKQITSIPNLITKKHPPEKNNANYSELHKTNEEQKRQNHKQLKRTPLQETLLKTNLQSYQKHKSYQKRSQPTTQTKTHQT